MLQAFKQKWVYRDSAAVRTDAVALFQSLKRKARRSSPVRPLAPAFSARSGPSWQQLIILLALIAGAIALRVCLPSVLPRALYWLCWYAFMGNALMRLCACLVRPSPSICRDPSTEISVNENLPAYSVIIALYHEAEIVPQVLRAMQALDYPKDRLEILFALEADDRSTIDAFHAQNLPDYVHLIEVPEGFPRTKPRALNYALERAAGDYIVIYDAEDMPHPGQLREAARVFSRSDAKLACLQAPLRPVGSQGLIAKQFAAEYAVQFDVLLPALHHLGLPFPLGGTSNHFKAKVLKAIGAWDAFNVTEDADLGLRLAQYGYLSGMLNCPTEETPPATTRSWIPQRTRWIKGYMQTLLVHTRLNTEFKLRAWLGLYLGVALSVAAAVLYAPFTLAVVGNLMMMGAQAVHSPARPLDSVAWQDLALFSIGNVSGILTLIFGARRAGIRLGLRDIAMAPVYWCLQSLAAGFALYQLLTRPFHWDKTEHTPVTVESPVAHLVPAPAQDWVQNPLYEAKLSAYGLEHDHSRHPDHLAHARLG